MLLQDFMVCIPLSKVTAHHILHLWIETNYLHLQGALDHTEYLDHTSGGNFFFP